MTNLTESSNWDSGVKRIDKGDKVLGYDTTNPSAGIGPSNEQAQALANRTKWLKDQIGRVSWVVVDIQALGALSVVVGDVGKTAYVVDIKTVLVLADVIDGTPVWAPSTPTVESSTSGLNNLGQPYLKLIYSNGQEYQAFLTDAVEPLGAIATHFNTAPHLTEEEVTVLADAAAPVKSVNGDIGDVVITTGSIGAVANADIGDTVCELVAGQVPTNRIPAIAVVEFLGAVANQAAMLLLVGQSGDWCIRSDEGKVYTIIGTDPTQISDWQALEYPAAPVTTVNGQVGIVVLSYSDVGADPAGAAAAAQAAAIAYSTNRANHTGTQLANTISDFNTAVLAIADAVGTAATAQAAAVQRSNHTGTQLANTISDLAAAIAANAVASFNGRIGTVTAKEWIGENYQYVPLLGTDCIEETGKSQFAVGVSNGTVSYPPVTTELPDATGVWKFTGNGANQAQFTVRGGITGGGGTGTFKLSAEPLVAIASFGFGFSLAPSVFLLSLQKNAFSAGDELDGYDGLHFFWNASVNKLRAVNKKSTNGNAPTTQTALEQGTLPTTASGRVTLVIVATSTSVKYYAGGNLLFTITDNIPTEPLSLWFGYRNVSGSSFWGGDVSLDLLQVFRVYKTTPRNLGIPSVTY